MRLRHMSDKCVAPQALVLSRAWLHRAGWIHMMTGTSFSLPPGAPNAMHLRPSKNPSLPFCTRFASRCSEIHVRMPIEPRRTRMGEEDARSEKMRLPQRSMLRKNRITRFLGSRNNLTWLGYRPPTVIRTFQPNRRLPERTINQSIRFTNRKVVNSHIFAGLYI